MKKNMIFIGVVVVLVGVGFFVFNQFFRAAESQTAEQAASRIDLKDLIKDHSPSMGPKDAPVQIVEYLDPECEACKMMDPIVKGLLKTYEGQVRYVVRYMPYHGNSMLAAVSLEEAREQGKYWEALSTLFYHQPEWGDHHTPKPELIKTYLIKLGVNPASLKEEYLMSKHRWKVDLDEADGKKLEVKGTPTFFVNGKMLTEMGYEPLKAAIDTALAQAKK